MAGIAEYFDAMRKNEPERWAELARRSAELRAMLGELPEPEEPEPCDGKHRGPEGPNEDMAQCPSCWAITYVMRPEGETFGWHADDCSLPLRHESYCVGGGPGHRVPAGETIRGYFGPNWSPDQLEHEPSDAGGES